MREMRSLKNVSIQLERLLLETELDGSCDHTFQTKRRGREDSMTDIEPSFKVLYTFETVC